MSDQSQSSSINNQYPEDIQSSSPADHRMRGLAIKSLVLLFVFTVGMGGGYLMGRRSIQQVATSSTSEALEDSMTLMHQVNPPDGFTIPAMFGDIGPKMLAAGAIDLNKFVELYQEQNRPLTDDEMTILKWGRDEKIMINPENANFLLNFFWAFGLSNENPILTEGLMVSRGIENVGGFASTAGWTLGAKDSTELYASTRMVVLTEEQQAKLLEVASAVYRPCCDNPTHFPDCNHGMAMLGLLELLASQGATTDEMFEAAKYVTAFWYPQQMLEVATTLKSLTNVDFPEADARTVVSRQYASGSGFQQVHQWLSQNGLLEQAPGSGGSCGVR